MNTNTEKNNVISNVSIFGLDNAVKGSKYPMATDVNILNSDITDTVKSLGTSIIGAGHDQFLTGIIAQFDLTFTVKAWTEAERYHFFDFISSQSTMHRIAKFDLDNQYIEYTDPRIIRIMNELKDQYNEIDNVPAQRDKKKLAYLKLLYSNPCGFKLTAKMTTNYRQLKTIYYQRMNHRLPEWRQFCEEIREFPQFKELVLGDYRG